MTSESAFPELTTLKVVHNGIARRVKIPYDMDWKNFERKVCRLFNVPPPLVTSYKDSMGVSVLVDNSEDFFFYLDEEYTGRLDIVTSDVAESSEWTVVRTDTGKALKETEDPSEISVDDVHALNSPDTISTRGSSVKSPLFTSTKEYMEKSMKYTESEKDESLTNEPSSSLPENNAEQEANSANMRMNSEDVHSTKESDSLSVGKYEATCSKGDISNIDLPTEDSPSLAEDEKYHDIPEHLETDNMNTEPEGPIKADTSIVSGDNLFLETTVEEIKDTCTEVNSPAEFASVKSGVSEFIKEEIKYQYDVSSNEINTNNEKSIERFDDAGYSFNDFKDSPLLKELFSVPVNPSSHHSEMATPEENSLINDGISEPIIVKEDIYELLDQGYEPESSVKVEEPLITESPEQIPNIDPMKHVQDLRQLCFRFGDTFRRHPSLLMTVELFTDQLANGVPINISILEQGLNRFSNSSTESTLTPSEAFEDLATNLAGSVSQLIQHVGNTFSTFIERDITPLVVPRRNNDEQETNNTTSKNQEFSNENTNQKQDDSKSNNSNDQRDLNVASSSHSDNPGSFRKHDGRRCHRHRCRRHRGHSNENNEAVIEGTTTAAFSKVKSFKSKSRNYLSKLSSRDNWLDHPRKEDHISDYPLPEEQSADIKQGSSSRLVDLTSEPKEDFLGSVSVKVEAPKEPSKTSDNILNKNDLKEETSLLMEERIRPVSHQPAPQIIPYYINDNHSFGGNFDDDSYSSRLQHNIPSGVYERKPQPYQFNNTPKPYRPLSFNDSINISPDANFFNSIGPSFSNQNLHHPIQICPPKPMNIPEVPSTEKQNTHESRDLGNEINPADVALIEGLVTLRSMGFPDDSANLEALQKNSNIADAVDYLLKE